MSDKNMKAPELANIEVQGLTRESFIMRGAIAAGSVYGLSTVGPFVSQALAQGDGDVDILNFALTLEYLEAAFYTEALKQVGGLRAEVKELATTTRDDENEHVDAIAATVKKLGGKPAAKPGVDFGKAFASEKTFLTTAVVFEDLGVGAYNGAGPSIKSKEVLAAAGSIVQVEGRHAGAVRLLNGDKIAPSPFDKGIPMAEVLMKAKPFIKS
ncbi:MAG TPA: ferritin-like domain-containing protein [Thermoleophilaceae bacterium]|nr:ferritin-like domain-containing protein [Thermoleophilaceae bacterium]